MMGQMSIADISEKMGDLDFCMLQTRTEGGHIAGRPMSNNGDVEYQGDSHFFTWRHSRMARDITRDPNVSLPFSGRPGLLGRPPIFISVQGTAQLIQDRAAFQQHWNPDLERWFEQGIDTPGMVMIKVHADRLHYWDGADEGELVL